MNLSINGGYILEANMNVEILLKIIDLIFDKHCEIKEVSYQHDALVCDDLIEMRDEIKENIKFSFDSTFNTA